MTVGRSRGGTPVGILTRRRPDGLTKTMVASFGLHLLCFALVIFTQVLSKLNRPNYQSFQVNLVSSGIGPASPGRIAKTKGRRTSASKKTSPRRRQTTKPTKSPGLQKKTIVKKVASKKLTVKKAVPSLPAKARTSQAKKSISKVLPPQAPPRARPPAQAPVTAQEDPDRLEEWWKKQSKTMKVAKIKPSAKQNRVVSPRRRTAKIDIMRKSIVMPSPGARTKASSDTSATGETKAASPATSKTSETSATAESPTPSPETSSPAPETSGSAVESAGDALTESDGEDSVQGGASEMASLDPAHQKGRLGSTGGASTGSTNFAFPGYLQRIDKKIRWRWAPPPITPEEDSLVVRFDIHKNGSINKMSVVVEESSGNRFFDQAALRAVYAAQPFPPLPEAYRDQTLTVYMHFIVREAS